MKDVEFVKYTSYGNNFVIVDETHSVQLSEEEKSEFAFQATSTCFGVGCDNLLFIQRCSESCLSEINRVRGYWKDMPRTGEADFIFRMFEPNGDEAFSCGNGLMAVADHLFERYGIESARVMTEVPFDSPRVVEIGRQPKQATSWANMGAARRVPTDLVSQNIRRRVDDVVDAIDNIGIRFRSYDLKAYTDNTSLYMNGFMVFTGEPHLVIFPHESFSDQELAKPIFSIGMNSPSGTQAVRRRASLGSWLIRRIGVFLNDQFRSHFPSGINVNFAWVDPSSRKVEYRCFERGINRETLACGTGAMAVAVVARNLGLTEPGDTSVLPYLCRLHDPSAQIIVTMDDSGNCHLNGTPRLLFNGSFVMSEARDRYAGQNDVSSDTLDLLALENSLLSGANMATAV